MNELEKVLYRKKKTLRQACQEYGIDIDEARITELETCSNCSIWYKSLELVLDLDENPICKTCVRFYGL